MACNVNELLADNCALQGYSERALLELALVGASSGDVEAPDCTLRGLSNRALREALLIAACIAAQSGGDTFFRISQIGDVRISDVADERVYQ